MPEADEATEEELGGVCAGTHKLSERSMLAFVVRGESKASSCRGTMEGACRRIIAIGMGKGLRGHG